MDDEGLITFLSLPQDVAPEGASYQDRSCQIPGIPQVALRRSKPYAKAMARGFQVATRS